MYEVNELLNSNEFEKRILPIVLDNAQHIFKPDSRLVYYGYWKTRLEDAEKRLEEFSNIDHMEQVKKNRRIFECLDTFFTKITDMNTLNYDKLKGSGFKPIYDVIYSDVSNEIILSETTNIIDEVDYERIEPGIYLYKDGTTEINIKMTEFFSSRLANAFPGSRGLTWFNDPKIILKRFEILFKSPLIFNKYPGKKENYGTIDPIWWFRGGASMPIENFIKESETKCLIGWDEFEINKIAVYRDVSNYRDFIYVETKEESPIEIDDTETIKNSINNQLSYKAYANQQYSVFRGIPIRPEEHDDGATIINGEIVKLLGESKTRVRFLTPYNFIICAKSSIYNSRESDIIFGDFMNEVLKGRKSEELNDFILTLLELQKNYRDDIDFKF